MKEEFGVFACVWSFRPKLGKPTLQGNQGHQVKRAAVTTYTRKQQNYVAAASIHVYLHVVIVSFEFLPKAVIHGVVFTGIKLSEAHRQRPFWFIVHRQRLSTNVFYFSTALYLEHANKRSEWTGRIDL